jgi:hypothetical protein
MYRDFCLEFLTHTLHYIPKMIKGDPVKGVKDIYYIDARRKTTMGRAPYSINNYQGYGMPCALAFYCLSCNGHVIMPVARISERH